MANKIYTHCLDPGHGGSDPGAVGTRSHEADIVLDIAKIVGRILVENGQNVIYTRTTDKYLTLQGRATIANNNKCDTFTSIHCNSAVNKTAHGVETFSYPASSSGAKLSKFVQAELVGATALTNRGCKTANFGVLRLSYMPAILVETAFISNIVEENALLQYAFQEKIAISIVKGIFSYLGLTFDKSTTTSNPPKLDVNLLSLQKSLNRLGFIGANGLKLREDGILGTNSIFAIKACESALGITASGTSGEGMVNAINSILEKPILKVGSVGIAVRYLQSKLSIVVDGIFGNNTRNSVIAYQNKNALQGDGIVGNKTWSKLII